MNRHPQAKPHQRTAANGEGSNDRFDTIEKADNRTERLDPERASATTDSVEDMLEAGESNADYEDQAHRVAPTLDPPDQAGNG